MANLEATMRMLLGMGMGGGSDGRGQTDRGRKLAEFRAARESCNRPELRNMYKMKISVMDNPPPPSRASLSSLRPILISEMTAGTTHKGRVLYGKLIEDAFRMAAVMTMVEDEAGEVTILSVYRALKSNAPDRMVAKRFPKGRKIAVKEPYFKVAMDGRLAVRVDNPGDFVLLDEDVVPVAPSEGQGSQPSAREEGNGRASSTGEGVVKSVEELREEGRKCFKAGELERAVEVYSRLVSVVEGSEEGDRERSREDYVIAYSNRAEAWLRLEKYEEALGDAVKALERDGGHVKSIGRKVRALCGLEIFHEAVLLLNQAMRDGRLDASTRTELKGLLRDAEAGDKQSRLGKYNLNEFYVGSGAVAPPKCRDFVGPVEIKLAQQGDGSKRRGLFVTKGVKPGDLLLVSNPLAVAKGGEEQAGFRRGMRMPACLVIDENLITEVAELCRKSPRRLKQLYSLYDGTEASQAEVPPMSLFLPSADSSKVKPHSASQEVVDVDRIRRIKTVNAFLGPDSGDAFTSEWSQMTSPAGLWVLPSFINHSCLPNTSISFVGDAMFLRATQNIQSGEEMTINYCDLEQPLEERRAFLKAHSGFECRCPRCTFEQELVERFPELNTVTKLFSALPPKDESHDEDATKRLSAAGARIAELLEQTLDKLPAGDAHKKDWVRHSYFRVYMCVASEHLRRTLKTDEWGSWAEHMYARLSMLLRIEPSEELLAQASGAVRVMEDICDEYAWKWMAKWSRLLKQICTAMYGSISEEAREALVYRYSRMTLAL